MTHRDIERWTREVAENPGAPAFVRLARAYRAQGRRDAARDVVLQGLEHAPENIRAHGLLALIHVEDGDRERAGDEWDIMLRLDPGNFDASRGLGFLALERGDLSTARRHLETAVAARPDDPAVTQALEVLERREGGAPAAPAAPAGHADAAPDGAAAPAEAGTVGGAATAMAPAAERDPARLFDSLAEESPFLGAVVVNSQGMVLAGDARMNGTRGDLLAALVNMAVTEARRTAGLLGMGDWTGLLLHCDQATVHVAGLPGNAVVLMAVKSDAPAGWAVRTAERAHALARAFLETQR